MEQSAAYARRVVCKLCNSARTQGLVRNGIDFFIIRCSRVYSVGKLVRCAQITAQCTAVVDGMCTVVVEEMRNCVPLCVIQIVVQNYTFS